MKNKNFKNINYINKYLIFTKDFCSTICEKMLNKIVQQMQLVSWSVVFKWVTQYVFNIGTLSSVDAVGNISLAK